MTENAQAFEYEKGQYTCHVFAAPPEAVGDELDDLIVSFLSNENESDTLLSGWIQSGSSALNCDEAYHITLIRGHRAIYYHEIKPFLKVIESKCASIKPVDLCLVKLRVFSNFEKTRQFLCLVDESRNESLAQLKRELIDAVDTFAIKLTHEDEDRDTLAHCSLLQRDVSGQQSHDLEDIAESFRNLCKTKLGDSPVIMCRVDRVYVRVGHKTHVFELTG